MKHLRDLSDDELLFGLEKLVCSQRELTARLIGLLGEVEERRLHLKAAYSSMFEFCREKLRMSEGEAFRRITAARLLRRFPVVYELIESGSVHLSALTLLRDHLTDENHLELFRQASGKTKRELEALLAARFPKPDAPSRIRKLPPPKPPESGAEPVQRPLLSALPPPKPVKPVEPLSAARYKIQFTADAGLKEKLERAQNLLSHSNPSGDLAVLVERAVDLLLADLERKNSERLTGRDVLLAGPSELRR
jgi:hypothetical protein